MSGAAANSRLLTPDTGVELAWDGDRPPDPQLVTDLIAAHGLVVVRGSGIADADGFEAFARSLGAVVPPPFLPEVRAGSGVSRLEHSLSQRELKGANGLVFASGWHADWSFLDIPPTISLLWCETAPSLGGDTVFCDSSAGLRALSAPFAGFLRTLRAVHSSGDSFAADGVYASRPVVGAAPASGGRASLSAVHPAVVASPFSAQECLLLNPAYTTHLEGLTAAESAAVLRAAYETLFWEEHQVRLQWTTGAAAIWDNTRLLHRAINQGVIGTRRILRANVRTVLAPPDRATPDQ